MTITDTIVANTESSTVISLKITIPLSLEEISWKDSLQSDFPKYATPILTTVSYETYYRCLKFIHELRDMKRLVIKDIVVHKCVEELNESWINSIYLIYPIGPFTLWDERIWCDVEIRQVDEGENYFLISMSRRESFLGVIPQLGANLDQVDVNILRKKKKYLSQIEFNQRCNNVTQHIIISKEQIGLFLEQALETGYVRFENYTRHCFVYVEQAVIDDRDLTKPYFRE